MNLHFVSFQLTPIHQPEYLHGKATWELMELLTKIVLFEGRIDKSVDLITEGDVLEHVSDPKTALKKAKSLLSEKGVLWLSTPNYNSGFSRLMKFKDAMWNQKNHFTYFSYETLLPILHEIGLDVEIYDISNRFNGSMELYCVNKKS